MSAKKEPFFEIYRVGLCRMSLCTGIKSIAAIEARANAEYPTGIQSRWKLSKDTTFATGEPNPCPCNNGGYRKHYLLSC